MRRAIFLQGLIIVEIFVVPVATLGAQVKPEEYMGCYAISEENRLFLSSPGDYDMTDISPLHCLRQCGRKYGYAALQEGNVCLCADSLPVSGRVDDAECDIPCPGSEGWPSEARSSLRCGGHLRNSIYSASERILGLSLISTGRLPVLKPVTISGNMVNGLNVTFTFTLGDGSKTQRPSNQPIVRHIYNQPGSYIVSMEATNPVTGSVTVSQTYELDDPLGPIHFTCPHSAPLGSWIECNGSLIRGSRVNSTFFFGDGSQESISLSSRYYSTGAVIPRDNTSFYDVLSNPRGIIVFPAYEFKHDGRVADWEFEVVRTGNFKLQVFRPRCSSGEVYCLSNKSCTPERDRCHSATKKKCQPSELFCLYRRHCIANTTESMRTCAPLTPYETFMPTADYELIWENRFSIATIGHHIKSLPTDQQPLVERGDVLGWFSEGGELAYRVITPADGAAFEFEYRGGFAIGDKVLRAMNSSLHHRHYILAAHYVHAAEFITRHLYNSTGIYYVSSNVTTPVVVAIDIPIGFDVRLAHPSVVTTHVSVQFEVFWHTGSNPSYVWDFGDGNATRTQLNTTTHTYSSSGTYYTTVIAANSVNQRVASGKITVYDFITGFKFARPIAAKAVGLVTDIEWETAEGTNVTYIIDFGDGSERLAKATTLQASRRGATTHRYASEGNYTVTVYAFNLVGPNVSISDQALVEIPVSDVDFVLPMPHVTPNVYIAVGDFVTVNRIVRNGSNVKCSFDFKDGSPPTVSAQSNTTHVYNETGTYMVDITCFNAWNSVNRLLNATIVVQNLEAISGLTLSVSPTIFGTDSEITILMNTGTTLLCTIDFGDDETKKIDFSFIGKEMYHRYRAVGSYNLSVGCWNRLGNTVSRAMVEVDIPIKDVAVTSEKSYIRVHGNISVDVVIKEGSRMKYVWNYGDGNTYEGYRSIAGESYLERRTHAYSTDGHFPVNVTVSNSLSSVTKGLPALVVVEYPVDNIRLTSSSPVKLKHGDVTYRLSLHANVTPPTDAFCAWDFGDGSTTKGPFDVSSINPYEKMHKFERTGLFTTWVNISNNISRVTLTTVVDVQELQDVSIVPFIVEGGVLRTGLRSLKHYFQSNKTVHFNVTSQPKDLSYTWLFGDRSLSMVTAAPYSEHVYQHPRQYTVKVLVHNILATLNATKEVVIQRAVGKTSLSSSYPTYNGDATYFSIEVEHRGTDSCLTLDLHDSHVVVFGEEHCRPSVIQRNFSFILLSFNETTVNFTHTYGEMGTYLVKLKVQNEVSEQAASTLVNITSSPCDIPSVGITGAGLSQNRINKVQKSWKLELKHQVTYRCPVAKSMVFTWSAFTVSPDWPDNETDPLELPFDSVRKLDVPLSKEDLEETHLTIRERKLPFGLIKFKFTLSFIGLDRDLSEIFGTASILVEVERSNILAVIKGSQRRSVGHGLDLVLDASDSGDPDVPGDKTGISFTWMCRKKDEEFPTSESVPNADGGCWANGLYLFGKSEEKTAVYTGSFIQNAEYVFRVIVEKESRQGMFEQNVLILPGKPPTMVIENVFNTLKKKNPFTRLVMESRCQDCALDDKLEYEWSLYLLREELDKALESSWELITDWGDKTAQGLNQSSLIIEPNFLQPGRDYRLQLNAWKPGGYPGGFVMTQFTMNIAPTGGYCEVYPVEGYALETDFHVKCNDWKDEDKPFTYLIELNNGGDIIPVYAGFESATSAVFPLGKPDLNFTMEVRIKVMDSYLLSTYNYFNTTVLEPKTMNYKEVFGDLKSAAGDEGGSQKAVQLATAASSVLNAKAHKYDNNSAAQQERAEFRGQVAEELSHLPVEDFDSVAMKGEALNSLTQEASEIDEDAQNASVKALDEMGDFLSRRDSARDVENVAKSLGSAIGNVVDASIKSYQKAANGTSPVADPSKSQNNTKNALGIISKVSGALLKQLAAGDKPKAISSPSLDLSVGRKTLEGISGTGDDDKDSEAGEGMGGVRLPNPGGLFGGANASLEDGATSAIGSTLSTMDKNPFAWDNTSRDLSSKTVGLSLTDGNGNPIDLAGQELELFVPRDLNLHPVKPMELNHFEDGDPPMRVHKFNRSSVEVAIVIEMKLFHPNVKLMVALRYDKKPTANHYDFAHTFPSLEEAEMMKKRPHPFTFVVPHTLLNPLLTTGQNQTENGTFSSLLANVTIKQFYLGVKAINKEALGEVNTSYALRIYLPSCKIFDEERNTWTSDGCKVGPKTIPSRTHCLCTPGEEEEVEEGIEGWEGSTAVGHTTVGLVTTTAAPKTAASVKQVVKRKRFRRSVHKISLASSMLVAPNPIDFNKVFNVNLTENPISLATVLSIFGVYLMIAVWARREDKKDVERAGVTPLEDNDPFDRYHYEITVYTGYGKSAGTTAQVYFILSGDEGESEARHLRDPKRKTFQRRGVDVFLATFPESFGELNYLHIWHNNTGRSPSWYVSRVVVQDLNNDKKYLFICENWLAVEEGDGAVDKLIPVAGHEEMTSFNHLFFSNTQKNLADGHLWFSVFIRPARSRFTRLQRVTCCLTLLYCAMLANAMFYEIGGETDPASTLQIGPLAFSPAQIGIGIISSLVVLPANIFIVGVFRNVEDKPSKDELKERRKRTCWWLQELFFCFFDFSKKRKNDFIEILHASEKHDDLFLDFSSATNLVEIDDPALAFGVGSEDISFRISRQEKREEMEKRLNKKKKKKKKLLPYWFAYVAWMMCFFVCFVAAFFVVLYGLQFGKEKSAQWISSMLVTFFQDVLISQPIKVLAIALVIAVIIKKPTEDDEENDGNKKKLEDEDWLHDSPRGPADKRMKPKSFSRLQPPDKSKLEKARELRFKERKMNAIIKEVTLYLFFIACLCIVSYSHRDPSSFPFRQTMYDAFVVGVHGGKKSFSAIGNRENFYLYAKTTLMTALYTSSWYNGNDSEAGFTADMMGYIVGMARLRQVRVENQSCEVAQEFKKYIHRCNDWYSIFGEDVGQYDVGWLPLKNESLYDPPFTYQAWEYNTSDELDTLPVIAFSSTYGGGGFVANLGETEENALRVIETLENNSWIDSRTRSVFTELAVYNPVANLFCVMTLVVEFLPTNGVFSYVDFKVARLFSFGGGFETFLVVCEFFIVLFFAVFFYQELKQLYRKRKAYFKDFWNYVEFFLIILVVTCIGMFVTRLALVDRAIFNLENNPGKYVSFSSVASWNELFMYMVSLVVFTAWIKAIKLMRFNRRVTMLAQTLKGSAGPLAAFSVVFVVFFAAYSLFAFAVFGTNLFAFYSFVSTCETVILLGMFDYFALEEVAPVLGPIFFFSFMVFGSFILMNMFLTIVMDVFAEVKDSANEQANEYEIVEFMIKRFKKFAGMQPNRISDDPEVEKKEMQEEIKEEMLALKQNQTTKKGRRKFKALDLVAQRFTTLESSLSGLYCEDWAEDRLLDHIVERRWGVNPEAAYAAAEAELKEEQHLEELRQYMYAAADRYCESDDERVMNSSLEKETLKNKMTVSLDRH